MHSPTSFFYTAIKHVMAALRTYYVVNKINWYKEPGAHGHEFLIAQVEYTMYSSQLYFTTVVERGPARNTDPGQDSSLPRQSLSISVLDTIRCLNEAAQQTLPKERSAKLIMTHSFHAFSLLEISRLIWTVSEHHKDYPINKSGSYWYAAMIMEVARRQYSPRARAPGTILPGCLLFPIRGVLPHVPARAGYLLQGNQDDIR